MTTRMKRLWYWLLWRLPSYRADLLDGSVYGFIPAPDESPANFRERFHHWYWLCH